MKASYMLLDGTHGIMDEEFIYPIIHDSGSVALVGGPHSEDIASARSMAVNIATFRIHEDIDAPTT